MEFGVWRTVRSRCGKCYETMRKDNRIRYQGRRKDSRIQLERLDDCCRQQIDRSPVRVRVERFHVNNTLVLRRHDFGKMRMDYRRLPCVHMHVKQGGIKRGDY